MQVVSSDQLIKEKLDFASHMQRSIDLACNRVTTTPNPRVGCVLVDSADCIVGEGWHLAVGQPHAEAMALERAGGKAKDSTAFVSLEPCSHTGRTAPCSEALIAAGVKRVVIASVDPDSRVNGNGIARLETAGIEVIHLQDFEESARQINRGYIKRMRESLPFVRCKLAMSLDGRTAMASGESKWITGAAARADVQFLRAQSCAIVTGIETILKDDPALNIRPQDIDGSVIIEGMLDETRQPLRAIVDSKLRTPGTARAVSLPGQIVIFTALSEIDEAGDTLSDSVEIEIADKPQQRVDLQSVLESLADKYFCNEVLIEAGPTLSGAFITAGLVDELIIYVAGKFMGDEALPLLRLPGIEKLADAIAVEIKDVIRVGNDFRITAVPGSTAEA
ncbi:MAG: bifunctional diaminohydroxyphosphoribosylaminopyrimidine deaminase/5-amino-6-(5-phosphoribosylamino)uracil reductase RibD [Gammaproteobacteria bacterium]|jgi:diaminohydroxyphosphoribosylaminopyrimidine deaminase/5-amino-6-(5-phosphoribosylamino)uracil reductase|nr:bifunctional diaminohydroxyphosphoribosylaminopyrimidine deaminase/5-amino-6-(5-phosphoribosylamino)uracil reductase RibD [Gammaproteobacteria bacterium]